MPGEEVAGQPVALGRWAADSAAQPRARRALGGTAGSSAPQGPDQGVVRSCRSVESSGLIKDI